MYNSSKLQFESPKFDSIPQPSHNFPNIPFVMNPTYPNYYYPYSPFQVSTNFNTNYNGQYNYIPQPDASVNLNQAPRNKGTEKRERKPLTVTDPITREIVDLNKQTLKNDLLTSEKLNDSISPNIISESVNTDITHSEIKIKGTCLVSAELFAETENPEIKSNCLLPLSTCQSIKQSHSIPNKLDYLSEVKISHQISSSSETDIRHKSNLPYEDIEDINNIKRKIYNRESLINIGKSKRSLELPSTLDNFECKEIIVTETSDSTKLFVNQNYGLNRRNHSGKVINIGSTKSTPRSRFLNGYLPPHLRLKEECSLNKHLEMYRRNLKTILNKIAPQNFNLCVNEIEEIVKSIDQQNVKIGDCIDCLIEEIFDKSVKEETYSRTYADLCTQIAKFDDKNESKLDFKPSLLNRCKKMFETPLQDQLKFVKEHWEQKVKDEVDVKLKEIYQSDIEEQVKKARDKYFGNVRFIGELYLNDLLKPKIINCCVVSLMPKSNDEDAMLSLCKLLETCGKKFDEKHQDKMDDYIQSMKDIIENEQLETRIRFRILDIIEMRDRQWSLRKIQAQKLIRPKTLDEVKNDDIEDKAIAASKFSSKQHNRLNTKPISNGNELRFKPNQGKNQSLDLNSLSVGQNENFELKPSYGNWHTSKDKDITEWKNVDSKKRGRGKYPQSGKHSQQLYNQNRFSPSRLSEEPGTKIISNSKFSVLISQETSDNFIRHSESPIRDLSPSDGKVEEDILIIIDGDELFDNLLETKELNEAVWCSLNDISGVISQWLDRIMEKNELVRKLVGDSLANLVANNKLPKDKLITGLNQFIELIDDLITDIPKIWTFLAQFLERFIQNESSDVEFFNEIFEERISDRKAVECFILILRYSASRLGISNVIKVVESHLQSLVTNISDKDLLAKNMLKNISFSIEHEIHLSEDKFSDSLKFDIISRLPNDVENIYSLLEQNFDQEEMQTDEFVYFIAHCLFSFICELPSDQAVTDFLLENQLFFIRIINNKPVHETMTLLALADFAADLEEKGSLPTIISNLLSGKIISKDAFLHFLENTDLFLLFSQLDNRDFVLIVKAIRSTLDNDDR